LIELIHENLRYNIFNIFLQNAHDILRITGTKKWKYFLPTFFDYWSRHYLWY